MKDRLIIYQTENSTTQTDIDRRYYLNFCFEKNIHAHPEFIYVTNGEVEIDIDGSQMTIGEDQFCIVLPWQIHSFYTPKYSRIVVLVVSSYYVDNFVKNLAGWRGKNQVFRAEAPIRDMFLKYLYEGPFPDEYIISATLLSLCHCFLQQCPLDQALDGKKVPIMLNVMDYITKNHAAKLSLRTVSNVVGYSYSHISHLFSDFVGMSFPQFLNMTRLGHARYQLLHTGHSVTDICFESGFPSTRCFNRVFRDNFGMSPTEYRFHYSIQKDAEKISIDEGMVQLDSGIPVILKK
ncbi:MAG: AraC family transcriptional regulator [Eubacteriales bacterium]|nr:AraC family transcriptional regulator [Eubacteriales bacterium]